MISIFINLVLIRLNIGSSQSISLPKNIKLVLTQVIRNKNEVGPRDDSDSKNKLQNRNNAYQITRTLPHAVIKEIFKDQSRYAKPSETIISLFLKLQQENAFYVRKK
jgi:hypothetical protein